MWRNIADFLALRRNTSLLLIALVLGGTGEKLWLGFAPKYLQTLGASIFVIGLFDAIQTLLGALYAYPGGWLTDRWGERRSLMLFNALSLSGYVLVLCWQHWLALLLGSFLFLAWSAFSLPTTFSVVANSLAANRHTMGIGLQSMVRRVPMMIGPLIGGALVTHFGWSEGVRYALLGCIGLGMLTAGFQWFMSEGADVVEGDSEAPLNGNRQSSRQRNRQRGDDNGTSRAGFFEIVRSFSPALRELLISDILIRFCERIPYAFVILWAMNHGGVSAQQFGLLVAVEMATAMMCYIPVAHLADKYGRHRFVLATFVFFTVFPCTLLWADNFGWLLLAFAVRGLKEFGEPARKALIIGEAASERRARTYGAYYLIRDCVVTSGSFLGAALWNISPQVNFIGAAVCGALGTAWFFHRRSRPLRAVSFVSF